MGRLAKAPMSPPPPLIARLLSAIVRPVRLGLWAPVWMGVVLAGCRSWEPPVPERGEAPDLVVVLLRDLRGDGPGPQGAEAAFLGAVSSLDDGVRFASAYAQSPRPHASLGAVSTGVYPAGIPLCNPPDLQTPDAELPWCVSLPAERPTLPEVLALYGYRTAVLALGSPKLIVRGEGDRLVHPTHGPPEQTWPPAVGAARDWWTADDGRPRLLIVQAAVESPRLRAIIDEAYKSGALPESERPAYLATHPVLAARLKPGVPWPILTAETQAAVQAEYVDTAARVGTQLETLLTGLSAGPRPRWTVLTSLHGMLTGLTTGTESPEQAWAGRSPLLLDRTLRVPLVVAGPGMHRWTVDHPVELVDIVPTLTGLAGAVAPAGLSGSDLLAQLDAPEPHAVGYSEFGDMLSLRYGDHFLRFRSQLHGSTSIDPRLTERLRASIPPDLPGYAPSPGRPTPLPGQPPHPEFILFDVQADPFQVRPLPPEAHPDVFRPMASKLLELREGPARPPESLMSFEQVQALRKVGALHYW